MIPSLVAAVIPCLNEAEALPATCASLGFRAGCPPPANSVLVLVDNGSTDGTLAFAENLRRNLPENALVVAHEPETGFLPPRIRGNEMVAQLATVRGLPPRNVLIAQADADTTYSPGYLEALRQEFFAVGLGVMLNACMSWPEEFTAQYRGFFDLCDRVDDAFSPWLADHPEDVVIDDKACAYCLEDYNRWGGHRREWAPSGEEFLAETTRLYLRGRALGASRQLCLAASACHSPRRLLMEPALSFATAGFPRGYSFRARWLSHYTGPDTLKALASASDQTRSTAVAARHAHLWGLFVLLPLHAACAQGNRSVEALDPQIVAALEHLPHRDIGDLLDQPSRLLNDVFELVDAKLNPSS